MKKIVDWFSKHKSKVIIATVIVIFLAVGLLLDFSSNRKTANRQQEYPNSASVSVSDTEAETLNSSGEYSCEKENSETAVDTYEISEGSKPVIDNNQTSEDTKPAADNNQTSEDIKPVTDKNETAKNEISEGSKPATDKADNPKDADSSTSTGEENIASSETEQDQYHTDPIPEGKPKPVEPENTTITGNVYHCTISISCATILNNMDLCNPDKKDIVPQDGWILKPATVSFNEGESVFDVLQRVCRENNIHMEFSWTPMYNSAYIEGINNIYEFDVGELSGWMYKVDDWFPNYGCSRYLLQDGQVVDWVYTCDLGYDVGEGYENR